ncbi:MAG: cytochrome b/b6 domain-containing protein [Magnetococcales bacterium]|nr:cytochrome b/b6 domain-containing protein [Magnetococcales bacterium]
MTNTGAIPVWDPLVRLFHWGLVAGVMVALVTGDEVLAIHVLAGHMVLGLVLFRLLWGLFGIGHARFGDFVRGPAQVFGHLAAIRHGHPPRSLGHNPAGGAMIVALLVVLALTGLSGLAGLGAKEALGPLAWLANIRNAGLAEALEEIHELFGTLVWPLVGLHLVGVVIGMWQHRENLVWSMVTGRKRECAP